MPPASDEERALLRAICAQPEDDVPRLVYADWLEEQGRGVRGEYIRLQCHLAQALRDPEQHAYRGRLIDNLQDLINNHSQEEYHEELPEHEHIVWGAWLRGFSGTVTLDPRQSDFQALELLAQSCLPIDTLNYIPFSYPQVQELLLSGLMSQVAVIVFGFELSASSPVVFGTEVLTLLLNHDWPQTVRQIVVKPGLSRHSADILLQWPGSAYLPVLDFRTSGEHLLRSTQELREHFGDRILLPGD